MPTPLYVVDDDGNTKPWDGTVKVTFPWELILHGVEILLLLAVLVTLLVGG